MDKNNILITGGSGNLGKQLTKLLPYALAPDIKQLDIRKRQQVFQFIKKYKPSIIYHLAAKTGIPACQEEPSDAWQTNVVGTTNLIEATLKFKPKARFIYISTACVFDGERGNYSEADFPFPKNYYGWTKLIGEFAAAKLPNHLIIRTNFVPREKWPHPKAFSDRLGTYLFADDLAKAIIKVSKRNLIGTVHVCGDRALSMYQLAKITTSGVQPMTLKDTKWPLTKNMTLCSIRLKPFKLTQNFSNKVPKSRQYSQITKCRICGNSNLVPIVNLGKQYLTGVFPKSKKEKLTAGPLELVKCHSTSGEGCGLVQLNYSYNLTELYGQNYGYRSGLNQSMVNHLRDVVSKVKQQAKLKKSDLIIDIGSNDSTLLQFYPKNQYDLVGIDPTGIKFKKYYPSHIKLIADFFPTKELEQKFPDKKAKIITSIAMFYDLESPLDFVRQIYNVLDNEGIWFFEQSYLPTMIDQNAYDTICHEHLEYYCLKQIVWMADKIGFKIIDVETNSVNGGSFAVCIAKKESHYKVNLPAVKKALNREKQMGLDSLRPYQIFKNRIFNHRRQLKKLLNRLKTEKKLVAGYGASTKGNVILQFCKLTSKDINYIAEINQDKFGSFTPGTLIPIISEAQAKKRKPDYFLVLPWHFKDGLVAREKKFLTSGGKMIFPLPKIEIISL